MEIARPLPIPSPWQPAPVTMAVLPASERDGGVVGISLIIWDFARKMPRGRLDWINSGTDDVLGCAAAGYIPLWAEDVCLYKKSCRPSVIHFLSPAELSGSYTALISAYIFFFP